ncbi:MAG: bifunctional alpha,alpha-trehalose-phosphate synthase (UDP-forming)/trehalose-phosphatase [candidate division WOR-3 bacterium]
MSDSFEGQNLCPPRRLIIVSNRLPVTITQKNGEFRFKQSVGGLVSGISTYLDSLKGTTPLEGKYVWIGWPGISIENHEQQKKLTLLLSSKYNAFPVYINEETMDQFYHGFCNKLIWPLFHYFPSYATYDEKFWDYYKKVNQIFADYVLKIVQPNDIIWIHDYHLMLLPGLIREKLINAAIGFFLHIPFPSFELFRLLPEKWRREILLGLLGSDLIGFHTNDYAQYFLRCVLRILGIENSMGEIISGERIIKIDTFPMGIDFKKFYDAVSNKKVEKERTKFLNVLGTHKIILSIDRLDYTKGILNRLIAYKIFLQNYPHWRKKVILVLVVVPSRIGVEHYQRIKKRINELVGEINGEFGTLDWTPIIYQYRFMPFYPLVALYSISDIAMVTPLRDGMNLIAKEYLACRQDKTGVLILSETAGAAEELREAAIINPNNPDELAAVIKNALEMDIEEQKQRNSIMQNRLLRYNVKRWAEEFLMGLNKVKEIQQKYATYYLTTTVKEKLKNDFKNSLSRLIFLDYDGTLVPFASRPEMVLPTKRILEILGSLSVIPEVELILISGRDRKTIQDWFGSLKLNLVAEHGIWLKEKDKDWELLKPLTNRWIQEIRQVMELYVDRLPGSFIEEKEYSIVWHYRNANRERAERVAKELVDNLLYLTANLDLQILQGSKVVEVRNSGVNKGAAALRWFSRNNFDFIMAIGDDWTDEDLFKLLLDYNSYTIKVGTPQSFAKYYVRSHLDVLALLEEIIK